MYVKVRALPGAKKERIIEMGDRRELTIHVREPAQQNMANRRIIQILAEHFSVPSRSIQMLSGFRSPNKIFSIDP
ncbi:DUF167 domain-containing protein [Candidatus Wolfebacteria bacterium]|nr:DUF167 domain-containing protein [Candidatus Wolfebacteria bacterium]